MKRGAALFLFTVMAFAVAAPALAAGREQGAYAPSLIADIYKLKLKSRGFTPAELDVHSIGQSHIDAAWKWRLAQTHEKVYDTWSQAIRHMDAFPDFTFSGSAPQYYEWIRDEHPDLFAKIVEREQEGRWEIVGGQWIEPDGNMPDGESFVRQRVLGQRFYLEYFGHVSEVSWMLDSFGYNRNMPQVMARSGAKYMWTSKLTWNDTTMFPFHNFWWRSPDGSQVLTHICPIVPMPTYFPYSELKKYKSTRYLLKPGVTLIADYSTPPDAIKQALSDDWLGEIGSFYGLGDGGLGPRKVEVRVQEALARKGYSRFSTGLELFQDIAKCSDRMPVWNEEMYLEFHRGVLTTQAWIKRANRLAEQMMRSAEVIRSVGQLYSITYPYESLKEVWKHILLNHFHDILPGSSIPEVYQDAREEYKMMRSATEDVKTAGLKALADLIRISPPEDGMAPMVVFNTLAWERGGLVKVEAPEGRAFAVMDGSGSTLASQQIEKDGKTYVVFRADAVPSVGYKLYYLKTLSEPVEAEAQGISITDSETAGLVLENEFTRVAIDKKSGWLTSLVDKSSGKELLSGPSNQLAAYFDRPSQYSAWNISKNYLKHPIAVGDVTDVKITSQGPLFVEAMVSRKTTRLAKVTTFSQRVRLVKGDPVLYLDLDSDFHLTDALTKVRFATVLNSDTVSADGPYLVLERPTHPQTASEKARWEMACQKWIDLSDKQAGMGLALLNNGKYGFSIINGGSGFALSVIKGARYPRANFEATNVKHHYYSFPIPTGFTDQGPQHAEMGLLVHPAGWREARLWEAGYNFNTPFEVVFTTPHKGKLPEEASFVSVDSEQIYLGAMKRAEDDDDLVLRLVEATGKPGTGTVKFGEGATIESAATTDLLELNPEPLSASGSSLTVDVGAYEIKTVKVKVSR
ncbi:MAG TPA: glycoside hydrolase family 38 C-terminal domain-containing protein [bacterium]|nr:glycoside hydrolase family 38 C-terminal domain-containing protein [bacterium]